MKTILQKFIAASGYCSRRKAEEFIREGFVTVNGRMAELGMAVDDGDEVKVDGEKIGLAAQKIYLALNKPKGYVCTNRSFAGEQNIFDLVQSKERLFVVGRLDKDSRGLTILTNDGDWANRMSHPRYEKEKEYEVKIINYKSSSFAKAMEDKQIINNKELTSKLLSGVDIGEGDGVVKAKKAEYLGDDRFKIILGEGKKRQIRRMFQVLGCEVEDLLRVRIGKILLGELKEGKYKVLNHNF